MGFREKICGECMLYKCFRTFENLFLCHRIFSHITYKEAINEPYMNERFRLISFLFSDPHSIFFSPHNTQIQRCIVGVWVMWKQKPKHCVGCMKRTVTSAISPSAITCKSFSLINQLICIQPNILPKIYRATILAVLTIVQDTFPPFAFWLQSWDYYLHSKFRNRKRNSFEKCETMAPDGIKISINFLQRKRLLDYFNANTLK